MLSKSDNMFEVLRSEIDDPAELHELLQLMREKKRKKLIWTPLPNAIGDPAGPEAKIVEVAPQLAQDVFRAPTPSQAYAQGSDPGGEGRVFGILCFPYCVGFARGFLSCTLPCAAASSLRKKTEFQVFCPERACRKSFHVNGLDRHYKRYHRDVAKPPVPLRQLRTEYTKQRKGPTYNLTKDKRAELNKPRKPARKPEGKEKKKRKKPPVLDMKPAVTDVVVVPDSQPEPEEADNDEGETQEEAEPEEEAEDPEWQPRQSDEETEVDERRDPPMTPPEVQTKRPKLNATSAQKDRNRVDLTMCEVDRSLLKPLLDWLQSPFSGKSNVKQQIGQNPQDPELKDKQARLEAIADHVKPLVRTFQVEQNQRSVKVKTVEELRAEGKWFPFSDFQSAAKQSMDGYFKKMLEWRRSGKKLSASQEKHVLAVTLACYLANERAVRAGILQQILMRHWRTSILPLRQFSTSDFKTRIRYRRQVIFFKKETIALLSTWQKHFRQGSDSDDQHFFRTSSLKCIRPTALLRLFFSEHMPGTNATLTTLRAIIATEANERLSHSSAMSIHRGDTHSEEVANKHYDRGAPERSAKAADTAFEELIGPPADYELMVPEETKQVERDEHSPAEIRKPKKRLRKMADVDDDDRDSFKASSVDTPRGARTSADTPPGSSPPANRGRRTSSAPSDSKSFAQFTDPPTPTKATKKQKISDAGQRLRFTEAETDLVKAHGASLLGKRKAGAFFNDKAEKEWTDFLVANRAQFQSGRTAKHLCDKWRQLPKANA